MITITISENNEDKIKELLMHVLAQSGYDASSMVNKDGVIKIINKNDLSAELSLKNTVIGLEENLRKEKNGVLYKSVLEAVERPLLEHVLEKTEGNQLKAARILGINRNTMRTKIKKLGIQPDKWKSI